VIPPKENAEFAADMEAILDTYLTPYNPLYPVLCMDEKPFQLLSNVRESAPETLNHGQRIDYEYKREGTVSIFMFTEPLAGWRDVQVRETRTKIDWAIEMANLLEGRYAGYEKIILVCDNLNTHTKGAFYQAFEPNRARELASRIEFRYTPKHGSWLNIAENELSSLTRQCIDRRRFGNIESLRKETKAWATNTNKAQKGVDWQFKVEDARIKLASLYPKIIV